MLSLSESHQLNRNSIRMYISFPGGHLENWGRMVWPKIGCIILFVANILNFFRNNVWGIKYVIQYSKLYMVLYNISKLDFLRYNILCGTKGLGEDWSRVCTVAIEARTKVMLTDGWNAIVVELSFSRMDFVCVESP